jgi:hypothetical protein
MKDRIKTISLLLTTVVSACAHGGGQTASPPPAAAASPSVTPSVVPASPVPTPVSMTPAKPVSPARATDLFNGKDLTGWELVAGAGADIAHVATIKNGVVQILGKPNGYIVNRTSYADYLLHVEWRWTDLTPNPATNGGVLVHVSSLGPVQQNLWPTSLQAQLRVQRAGDLLAMGQGRCAETPPPPTLSSPSAMLLHREPANEAALGEWNTMEILMRGASIELTLNGVVQNRATNCNPFSGRIGFQLEGYPFELRNVRVGPLPARAPDR